jgi:Zn-dependent peptidase ImmA (M78 family)
MTNEKASQLFNKAKKKFSGEYPVPVLEIAKEIGLDVFSANFSEDLDDSILGMIQKNGDKFTIFVNEKNTKDEEIFTVAHEIGHFVLHQDYFGDGNIVDYKTMHHSKNHTDKAEAEFKIEVEANNFALNLLFPNVNLDKKALGVGCLNTQTLG